MIIATLAALAWPNYMAIKEKTLNREAKASLALIRAAEKIYRLEQGFYYPYLTTTSVASDINSYLKLSLPESASVSWAVSLSSPDLNTGVATSTRVPAGRVWSHDFANEDPTCSPSGPNCP